MYKKIAKIISETANFFEKLTACFGDLSQFEQRIQQIATLGGINLNELKIDHLAVRVNSEEKAKAWWALLLEYGCLMNESQVNGRTIGLFELTQAVEFCGQKVNIIELPFPKGKIYPQEGWEHIEVVFPMLDNETVEKWLERTLEAFHLKENTAVSFKISQPKVNGEKFANPTIALNVNNATFCNHTCLKLHPYDIKQIVFSERSF